MSTPTFSIRSTRHDRHARTLRAVKCAAEPRLPILGLLAVRDRGVVGEPSTRRLCEVSAQVTGVTGAGMMLMSGVVPRGQVCTSDHVSAVVEQLQCDLGEGPCIDAYTNDRPVLEPDLEGPATPRWFGSAGPAVDADSGEKDAS